MPEMRFVDIYSGSMASLADVDASSLSQDEFVKARSFKTLSLQNDFIRMRATLRQVLASYLNCEPFQVKLAYGEFGKPFLPDAELFFNVSHSHGQWVISLSDWSEVGVDIEHIKPRVNLSGLTHKVLAESERLFLLHHPLQDQLHLFYWFWVRKEAWVKAIGRGVAAGLSFCEIDLQTIGQFAALPSEYGSAEDWQHIQLNCHSDYAAALVVKSGVFELRYRKTI